ncbi:thioredoxin domain-containing protein [Desulfolithobacter dissulfuricans]|uniref:Thioredoxin domain-containing protein n=1 Tax=Desulfolithobacter dissulfuricans TaxID=2795293 RepID=A0A915TZ38_9BACT|nr:thioredoxin domain-containing protein [Desulfolithobacter dissulfuricans]BCO08603.1 thioredoxin domain-containing protein [Desulfolithobacter dissulfuricans]
MPERTNRLAGEKSPYLLQHAHDPVDWYPWGREAFDRARAEDRPIFLSIGYSTCHWCHVMARESFASPAIAELLNSCCVAVKVDREERPDVDQFYMAAIQAMNGAGGWPLSMFLFPDGRPFYAATYIPAKPGPGRPGFGDILRAVHRAWHSRRDELRRAADSLVNALIPSAPTGPSAVPADVGRRAFEYLTQTFDKAHGGFGHAPKFPRPVAYDFLLHWWHATGEAEALEMVRASLEAMTAAGLYDHLGGGFHRYCVDRQWQVPHFEKMLYDQAQMALICIDMYRITGDPCYETVVREVLDYVLRDLRADGGGFCSAEDADSADPDGKGGHGEGAFYLWTHDEIMEILGERDGTIFSYCYGVRAGGNVAVDPQGEFGGKNILHRAHTLHGAADHFGLSQDTVAGSLARSKEMLFAKRCTRPRPHRDDKIIAAWNGLMIAALARAGAVLAEPGFTGAAVAAATFLRRELYLEDAGRLHRSFRDGTRGPTGQLADYVFVVAGLLELYQVVHEPCWLAWAEELTDLQITLFHDREQGGFFDSVADPTVVLRMKADYDGAEPAPNSVAVSNLLRLAALTGRSDLAELVAETLKAFAPSLDRFPGGLVAMLCAWMEQRQGLVQVVVAGEREREDTRKLLEVVHGLYLPGSLVLLADQADNQACLGRNLPFIAAMVPREGRATAHVCRDRSCLEPVSDPVALSRLLQQTKP